MLQVASEVGRQVPVELGVVGFDGLDESTYYLPPLTTVFQDQHRLGCTAVEEVVKILRQDKNVTPDLTAITLTPELIDETQLAEKPDDVIPN